MVMSLGKTNLSVDALNIEKIRLYGKEMLKGKRTLPKTSKYVTGFVLFEGTLLIGSYYVYRRMNTSREFRHYMYECHPKVLNGFYYIGEYMGNLKTREEDQEAWKSGIGMRKM